MSENLTRFRTDKAPGPNTSLQPRLAFHERLYLQINSTGALRAGKVMLDWTARGPSFTI